MSTEQNHAIDTTIGAVNDSSVNDNIINLYSMTRAEYQKIRKSFHASTATSQCERGNHTSQGTI